MGCTYLQQFAGDGECPDSNVLLAADLGGTYMCFYVLLPA